MSGFEYVPKQLQRKSVKKGFDFSIIVVGESGLGKSTLIEALFQTNMIPDHVVLPAHERITQTLKIDATTVEIDERGLRLRLTVIDTPGYADAIDSTGCIKPVYDYIEKQFENYFVDESGVNRRNIIDTRIHCCLYFIAPNCRGLKQIDINFMKKIQGRTNLIPIIAKADALTQFELSEMKRLILKDLSENNISIYGIPDCDPEDEPEFIELSDQMRKSMPFAVIGSTKVITCGSNLVRGREYIWGSPNIDDPKHCDFSLLRNMLIRTHTQDLKDITEEIHYENYRAQRLTGGVDDSKFDKSYCMSDDSEKSRLLAEKDFEIRKMQEMLAQMKSNT